MTTAVADLARNWRDRMFGPPDARRMMRENLRGKADFVAAAHAFLKHPVTLYTYALPLTLLFVGLMKPEYPNLDAPEYVGHLLTSAKVLVFWGANWLLLGHILWWAMPRGVPFVAVPMTLWLVAVVGSQALSLLIVPGFEWSWVRLFRQATLTLPSTLVAVHAVAPILRERLGDIPELVPIWSSKVGVRVPLLLKLPPERRGRIRRIHAANQYVEVVTDQGVTLLRMSLREAVALLPADKGWWCHRSLWIRRDEVVAVTYTRGQPQITDRDGQIWPISRKAVSDIRDWLNLEPVDGPQG